jgi:putative membrane protein
MDLRITFRIAWKRILSLFVVASLLVAYSRYNNNLDLRCGEVPAVLLGMVVVFLLAWRSYIAYERWNEAQKQWSFLVSATRSTIRKIFVFMVSADDRKQAGHRQLAFLFAVKNHLRRQGSQTEIAALVSEEERGQLSSSRNVPGRILSFQSRSLQKLVASNVMTEQQSLSMENDLDVLTRAFTRCEQIKETIPPRQWTYYCSKAVAAYSYVLPFFFIGHIPGWFVVVLTVLLGFLLFAIDSIAKGVENPFDNTINDVPMSASCRVVENELRVLLGEPELPILEPVNGFLY